MAAKEKPSVVKEMNCEDFVDSAAPLKGAL
jgi:hypothetical protein